MVKLSRTLKFIEDSGNKLPNPTLLFIYLCGFILLASAFASWFDLSAIHPVNQEKLHAKNLLSTDGLHYILKSTVTNFTSFAPFGSVLVAIMGIGIAEHSGIIGSVLRHTVVKAPKKLTTFVVVVASVLSSIALDTGYVVLIPLAAIIFQSMGRNPIAGIVAAFAGVSGGFSANIIVGPVDSILAGISTEAAQLVETDYEVNATGNYYFIAVSTLLIGVLGTFVTEKIVAKWLPEADSDHTIELKKIPGERRGLIASGVVAIVFILGLLMALVPENGILRDPETGSILRSPFISGIIVIISFFAAICGIVFAKCSNQTWKNGFVVEAMEKHIGTMVGYIVLMFFAAQFVNYFGWSQLGSIFAISGANVLSTLEIPKIILLVAFVFLAAFINLFIGSASAKWALIAPIFVPMLLLSGISPEATQMAYRIGDSSTNIITPLMPYFGVVVAFAQHYKKDLGMGTLISVMLPYSIVFLIGWTLLLIIWTLLGLPLGPQSYAFTG